MKIRFRADADLSKVIIAGVRRRAPEIDFLTANEVDLRGLTDFEVLEIGARENRILVSHDFKTMPAVFAQFLEEKAVLELLSCRKV